MIYTTLSEADPEMHALIAKEEQRQRESLELIASENFAPVAVLQASGSILANKYSEGQVGQRYYGGNEHIDVIERLCKARALALFGLDAAVWDVNVQPLSGTIANLAVYTALAGRGGRILGLSLPAGGHLSHGFRTPTRWISASGLFFESAAYTCDADGLIDYPALITQAREFAPAVLVCGGSAYPRDIDYVQMRAAAGNAFLMADISHYSGLVVTGVVNNPFEHCDVVTTTTHKLLRGPRSAMIFYRRTKRNWAPVNGPADARNPVNPPVKDVKKAIDGAVFPGLQGGPHNQKIGALAVALRQAATPEYRAYALQVYKNAKVLGAALQSFGYRLSTGGTDCHLLLVLLEGIDGAVAERACELVNISLNKNATARDTSMLRPTAIRLGTPALTTRGLCESDFERVAFFVHSALELARHHAKGSDGSLEEFTRRMAADPRTGQLKEEVIRFVSVFPFPVAKY